MRTIISTSGTSIATGCPSLPVYSAQRTSYDDSADDLEAELRERVQSFQGNSTPRVCAEINSLARLGVKPEDDLVLLTTDTVEGRICASTVAREISRRLRVPKGQVIVRRIEGLQVHDADRLRRVGLPRLMEAVLQYVDQTERREGGIILNQTGGFKGVVPFLTVVGMLFGLKTIYLFEGANELVELPPLPVSIDFALFDRVAPALQEIKREGVVPLGYYHHLIRDFAPGEAPLFASFVESDGQSVTLSPLTSFLLETERHGPDKVALSIAAASTLQSASGFARRAAERLLERLHSGLWRSTHRHRFATTDLEVYKPGDTSDRAACVTIGDRINVCELYLNHETYESDLPKRRRSQYDFATFVPYESGRTAAAIEMLFARERDLRIEELEREVLVLRQRLKNR